MKHLAKFESWSLHVINKEEMIVNTYKFSDIYAAMDFINSANQIFETEDHHPTKLVWQGDKVEIWLNTHSSASVTEQDIQLSKKLDEIYQIV